MRIAAVLKKCMHAGELQTAVNYKIILFYLFNFLFLHHEESSIAYSINVNEHHNEGEISLLKLCQTSH